MTSLSDTPPLPETETVEPFDPELKKAGELTSPTWELELFLSGAFVFATFQLPGLIEGAFTRLEPHATDTTAFLLILATLYGKAIAFTLIAMFMLHLGLRAYWVGLMGLRSVFPQGIRWQELRVGPISRDVYETRTRNLPALIERIDNISSVVFSVGLLIVLVFAGSTLLVGGIGVVAYLAARVFSGGRNFDLYLMAGILGFVALPGLALAWDRRFGKNYAPGSRAYRSIYRILSAAHSVSPLRLMGPMMWTLMSNFGPKRVRLAFLVAMFSLIALSAFDRLANSDRISSNTYDFFGASRTRAVSSHFYENQREEGRPYFRIPSIQADVIKDPYVKLFIPYWPRRDNAAFARACPGLKPLQEEGISIGADQYLPDSLTAPALACMAKVHAVRLDGAAIPDLQFMFYEQPRTGLKGVIAYIPVDSMARGRHMLEVRPSPPLTPSKDSVAAMQPFVIPFWK